MIRFLKQIAQKTRPFFNKKTTEEKIITEKALIREEVKSSKKRLSIEEKTKQADLIFDTIETLQEFNNAQTILMYWSMDDEVPTHQFIRKWSASKTILLPVVKGHLMTIKTYSHKDDMEKNSFGVLEPRQISDFLDKVDLAIIPGLAFDRNKRRLGRGKGYYDRYLKNKPFRKWGVCFDFQLYHSIPSASFDIRMDKIITCNEVVI